MLMLQLVCTLVAQMVTILIRHKALVFLAIIHVLIALHQATVRHANLDYI